jgi:hypothetical protein
MNIPKKDLQDDIRKRFLQARREENEKIKRDESIKRQIEKELAFKRQKEQEEFEKKKERETIWKSFYNGRIGELEAAIWWDYENHYFLQVDTNYDLNYCYTIIKYNKSNILVPFRGTLSRFLCERDVFKSIGKKKIGNFINKKTIFEAKEINHI